MQLRKPYDRVIFSPYAIKAIISELKLITENPSKMEISDLRIDTGKEAWRYDSLQEFIAAIGDNFTHANLEINYPDITLEVDMYHPDKLNIVPTSVSIKSNSHEKIVQLINKIDEFINDCTIPTLVTPAPPEKKCKIFIGHGGSEQWRKLKDHLQDQHNLEVIAYETGSRSGHSIRDIITGMLNNSSMAFLIMAGEDIMEDKTMRSRQNVIHEIGLFQAKLGFEKAIVLKEDGTEEFSNLAGVQQIRYSKGNIKESFGDALAVIKRELGV